MSNSCGAPWDGPVSTTSRVPLPGTTPPSERRVGIEPANTPVSGPVSANVIVSRSGVSSERIAIDTVSAVPGLWLAFADTTCTQAGDDSR